MDLVKLASLYMGLFRHLMRSGIGRKEQRSLFLPGDSEYGIRVVFSMDDIVGDELWSLSSCTMPLIPVELEST